MPRGDEDDAAGSRNGDPYFEASRPVRQAQVRVTAREARVLESAVDSLAEIPGVHLADKSDSCEPDPDGGLTVLVTLKARLPAYVIDLRARAVTDAGRSRGRLSSFKWSGRRTRSTERARHAPEGVARPVH